MWNYTKLVNLLTADFVIVFSESISVLNNCILSATGYWKRETSLTYLDCIVDFWSYLTYLPLQNICDNLLNNNLIILYLVGQDSFLKYIIQLHFDSGYLLQWAYKLLLWPYFLLFIDNFVTNKTDWMT